MFTNLGNIIYKTEQTEIHIQISSLEEGTNLTKDFIIYKDEELIRIFSRKCDHNGGKLCKIKEKIACPLHGWEFNPESGSYTNIQFAKKEEDFYVDGEDIVIGITKDIPKLPHHDKNFQISVELLSHACLLFTSKDFSFATDPWIEGFAFSSGWWTSQYPPKLWEEKLNSVDFIYISHNHPDHLNQFTLEKIRKDMQFIVPAFQNDSVRKLLNRFGFNNIISFDLSSFYQYKDSEMFFSILKSGDFREDSGFYFTYGNFSCLSSVDSNDLNFSKLPENISLYCSSFAGGASGYPFCFENISEQKKKNIIERNTLAIKATVKNQIKICKPKFYIPYAGFFSERAPRDSYIKNINTKNEANDYLEFLDTSSVHVLDTSNLDSFSFNGDDLQESTKIERYEKFAEDPESFYSRIFSECYINNDFIEEFFTNSGFQDNLKVYFELTNADFTETFRYVFIDFSSDTPAVNFKEFDWKSIRYLYLQNSKMRHLRIKVREDSFSWVLKNNMPFEDLSIGFQCRIDRVPDIYNVEFWNYFTNVYIA
jgi:CMP-N-acetylneuraminate monooxygenase